MNFLKPFILIAGVALIFSCNQGDTGSVASFSGSSDKLENELDSVSYSLGVSVAKSVKQQGADELNIALVAKAFEDVMAGEEVKVDENEVNQILQTYFQSKFMAKMDNNKTEGEAFLAKNKDESGVTELESGLQYKIITEGNGAIPTATDKVTVHYHGTLIDGTVFDSSVDRGEPTSFPVNGVIKGWTEALQLMPVGSKWMLYVPTDIAYGQNPRQGGVIEPNMALIFEVELISIDTDK